MYVGVRIFIYPSTMHKTYMHTHVTKHTLKITEMMLLKLNTLTQRHYS